MAIQRELGNPVDPVSILKISLSSAIMSVVVSLAHVRLQVMVSWKVGTVIAIALGVIIYGILIVILGVITAGDLQNLPFVGRFFKRFKSKNKR